MKLQHLLNEALREDADRDAMLSQLVKNPETGQDITVKTALGYDKNHPARKAAAKIYATFMGSKGRSGPSTAQKSTSQTPESPYHTNVPNPSNIPGFDRILKTPAPPADPRKLKGEPLPGFDMKKQKAAHDKWAASQKAKRPFRRSFKPVDDPRKDFDDTPEGELARFRHVNKKRYGLD